MFSLSDPARHPTDRTIPGRFLWRGEAPPRGRQRRAQPNTHGAAGHRGVGWKERARRNICRRTATGRNPSPVAARAGVEQNAQRVGCVSGDGNVDRSHVGRATRLRSSSGSAYRRAGATGSVERPHLAFVSVSCGRAPRACRQTRPVALASGASNDASPASGVAHGGQQMAQRAVIPSAGGRRALVCAKRSEGRWPQRAGAVARRKSRRFIVSRRRGSRRGRQLCISRPAMAKKTRRGARHGTPCHGAAVHLAGQSADQPGRARVPADPTKVQGPNGVEVGARSLPE